MTPVPRIGRILDVVGLLLFLAGAAFYVRAWIGFGTVPSFVPPPDAEPWAAVAVANRYWRLQKIGVALMIAGLVGFVAAWWTARRALVRAETDAGRSGAPDVEVGVTEP